MEYVLRPEGVVRREILETSLAPTDDLLRQMANASPVVIANAFRVNGQPVHLRVSPRGVSFAVALNHIVLNTTWAQDSSGTHFYPVWHRNEPSSRDALVVDFAFSLECPPERTFLVYSHESGNVYIVQYADGRINKLALPNVYDDARVCMGSGPMNAFKSVVQQRARGAAYPDLPTVVSTLIEQFHNGTWNTDLLFDWIRDGSPTVLRFAANGTYSPVDPANTLFDYHLVPVSNDAYNWLPSLVEVLPPPPARAPAPAAPAPAAPAAPAVPAQQELAQAPVPAPETAQPEAQRPVNEDPDVR